MLSGQVFPVLQSPVQKLEGNTQTAKSQGNFIQKQRQGRDQTRCKQAYSRALVTAGVVPGRRSGGGVGC